MWSYFLVKVTIRAAVFVVTITCVSDTQAVLKVMNCNSQVWN